MLKNTLQKLDITKIQTIKDLNSTNFSKYVDKPHSSWVRYINMPVSTKDLDRVCDLSEKVGSKVTLGWSMGDLYYKMRALPQVKVLKQSTLFKEEI